MLYLLFSLLLSEPAWAEWPEWRGPNRDGVVRSFPLPEDLPDELDLVWREKVGYGYASPVVKAGDA